MDVVKIQEPGIEPGTSAVLKPRHNQLDHPCITDNFEKTTLIQYTYTLNKYTTSLISQHTFQILNKYPTAQTYILTCPVHSLREKLTSSFLHIHVFTDEVQNSCLLNPSGKMGPMPRDGFSYYCAVRVYIFGIQKLTRSLVPYIYTIHMHEKFKFILKVIDTL